MSGAKQTITTLSICVRFLRASMSQSFKISSEVGQIVLGQRFRFFHLMFVRGLQSLLFMAFHVDSALHSVRLQGKVESLHGISGVIKTNLQRPLYERASIVLLSFKTIILKTVIERVLGIVLHYVSL